MASNGTCSSAARPDALQTCPSQNWSIEISRTESVRIRRQQSVTDDIAEVTERITRRAHEIFERGGGSDLEYKNGILKIQAPLSKEQTRKIEIDAA